MFASGMTSIDIVFQMMKVSIYSVIDDMESPAVGYWQNCAYIASSQHS